MTVIKALVVICCLVCGVRGASAECESPGQTGLKLLPKTDAPRNLMPLPKPGEVLPADCDFYQWAWQTFMYVTQPTGENVAFLRYPTFEDLFGIKASPLFADERAGSLSLAPRNAKLPNASTVDMRDYEQAGGLKDVLIDQNGNLVWYAIHVNQEFARFIKDYQLTDPNVLAHIPKELEFRPGVVELKSAWQIVEGSVPKNYITTSAIIPLFMTDKDGKIVKDGTKTRKVTVALLGIHVVGVIEGHPEFVWATFEHVSHKPDTLDANQNWSRDVAPVAQSSPDQGKPMVRTPAAKYALYPGGGSNTPVPVLSDANKGVPLNGAGAGQNLTLDVQRQKFAPVTPVYRIYPGSLEVSGPPDTPTLEDGAVAGQNNAVKKAFEKAGQTNSDVRGNYQLVGAVWLNNPGRDLIVGNSISDTSPVPPPPDPPIFGGENRLSSTTMESFTQDRNSSPNCFACHDASHSTGPITLRLQPSKLNVSHVLSKYYELVKLSEHPASEAAANPK
jgi:hypothetical protein